MEANMAYTFFYTRSAAVKHIEEILIDSGYFVAIHCKRFKGIKLWWLEIWQGIKIDGHSRYVGDLYISLLGTLYTVNMLGCDRKAILQLVLQDGNNNNGNNFRIEPTPKEAEMSKHFWEVE